MEKEKENKLKSAVNLFLLPSEKVCNMSSYGLKHMFEKIIDEYVSNDDMKTCMIECGFQPLNPKELNHMYNARVKPAKETNGYYDIYCPEADDNILLKVLWANRSDKRDDMIGDLCYDLLRDPDFIFLPTIDEMLDYIVNVSFRSYVATEAVCLFIVNFCKAFEQYNKYLEKLDKEDLKNYGKNKCKLSFKGLNTIEINKEQKETELEKKLSGIRYISTSYLAKRFFGKSRSWLNNKIRENDDARRNSKYKLSDEELKQLKEGLFTLAEEIKMVAENIN